MNKKDIKEIQEKLLQEKRVLTTELEKISKKSPHNPQETKTQFEELGNDRSENTSEVVKFGLNIKLRETLEKSLKDIEKTLTRIKKGNYGTCKYCKQPITAERLKARPTSSSCIDCKTKLKSL